MVHVEDMGTAIAFHRSLGAEVINGGADDDFAVVAFGATELALLAHPPNPEQAEGTVELNFVADSDLDAVEDVLRARGVAITGPVTVTGFGRQLQVTTPDGLLVKINEFQW